MPTLLLLLLLSVVALLSCCREVETLFHEFGHALQHMMTTVDEGLVAGIRWGGWH
jgi:Zn-dependent oligopeptidase